MSTRSTSSNLFSPLRDPESLIQRRNLDELSSLFDFEEVMNNNHNYQGPPPVRPPPPKNNNGPPPVNEDLQEVDVTMIMPSIKEQLEFELKDLPSHLEYVFLEGTNKLTIIIFKELKDEEKAALLKTTRLLNIFLLKKMLSRDCSGGFFYSKNLMSLFVIKSAENLAADHLSRLENPHEGDLEKKEINETFPLETLRMIYFNGDSSTPWFADIANYHARNLMVILSSERDVVPTKEKPVISSRLAIIDPPGDIMVRTTSLRKSLIPVSTGRQFIAMPMTCDHGTHFCNDQFAKVMLKYGVTHYLSIVYHLQTSGQVEVSNRGLKRILERTIGENRASWSDKLDDALWAFCITFKTPIRIAPDYEDSRARGFVHRLLKLL
nr:reverse transcriptase domain-containing protein [Tanacetum cinerariifolium]